MKYNLKETIQENLNDKLRAIENEFEADVIFFYGPIYNALEKVFRDFIEDITDDSEFDRKRLVVILNTPGGSAETVEILVKIIRNHYTEVYFVVPDSAMSAGTIFCMSGDRIYMDYSSSLGPIDPQVHNGKNWVPALGYLDKVEELIKKSNTPGQLSEAEYFLLKQIDLGELRSYEMARNLTVALLKEWLVQYKFKSWITRETSGATVTDSYKKSRAQKIAEDLSNNDLWHSHGRSIGIKTLTELLKLKIEDYSNDKKLRTLIRDYNDLIIDYIFMIKTEVFLHSRIFFT